MAQVEFQMSLAEDVILLSVHGHILFLWRVDQTRSISVWLCKKQPIIPSLYRAGNTMLPDQKVVQLRYRDHAIAVVKQGDDLGYSVLRPDGTDLIKGSALQTKESAENRAYELTQSVDDAISHPEDWKGD
jgi:hypothetical protein